MSNRTHPNEPIQPVRDGTTDDTYGLTKREHFASEALKGILSNPAIIYDPGDLDLVETQAWCTDRARDYAEALVNALNYEAQNDE